MKNRWKALFLAAGLTVCALGVSVYAEQTTEGAAEQVTEAAVEDLGAAEELTTEAPVFAADGTQLGADDAYYSSQMEANIGPMLEALSAMTDEQLMVMQESNNASEARLAAGWLGVKEELGTFVEVGEQSVALEEDGKAIVVTSDVKYDGVSDSTKVLVNYTYNKKDGSNTVDWDIKYPMSKLIKEAGLNTLLGLGTVFVVLIFLSFVIGNIHWIPDIIESRKKKNAPVKSAPAPAPAAPAPAAPAVEEDLTDDEELVAVIAAAIAASEEIPVEGFRVRSIRKAKRRSALEF